MAVDVTLTKYHGDTWILPLTFYGADGETPENLEGIIVNFSLKLNLTDTEALISDADEGVEVDVDEADEGKITIQVEAELMATLTAGGKYYFDVQFTDDDDVVETQFVGKLKIKADVTP